METEPMKTKLTLILGLLAFSPLLPALACPIGHYALIRRAMHYAAAKTMVLEPKLFFTPVVNFPFSVYPSRR